MRHFGLGLALFWSAAAGPALARQDGTPVSRPATVEARAAALVGHYYLSGVHEVGSELLLRADGTFDWGLAYGAIDQAAKGNWRVDGDAVLLVADLKPSDAPLFAYAATEGWSAEAVEERAQRAEKDLIAAVHARCPFLPDLQVVATSAPPLFGDNSVPAATLRDRAAAAMREAVAARSRVEALAAKWTARSAADPARLEAARAAMDAWSEARSRAAAAADAAGLPSPNLAEPALPEACRLPEAEVAGDSAGLGVRVIDPASSRPARNVQVTLRFTDGSVETVTTGRGGYAFLPGKPGAAAMEAALHLDQAPERDGTFTFPPARDGILRFSVDLDQLALPAFVDLRLRIDDGALLLGGPGDGRYERRP